MATIPRAPLYDMADVIKTIYAATIKADPPRIAALQLEPLMTYLEDVTKKAREHMQRLQHAVAATHGVLPGRGNVINVLEGIKTDLDRWESELGLYRTSVNGCIAANKGADNECTLWSVAAPLFFGIYDGPLGTSSPKTPGLRAPFQIANQLDELQHFENTEGLDAWRYIGEETSKTFSAVGETVAGTLRLLGEVAGRAAAGAAGGILAGLGPLATLAGGIALAWVVFRGRKGPA